VRETLTVVELVAEAVLIVGAPGVVAGIATFELDEVKELPIAFLATTVKEYSVPLLNPVTTMGDAEPVAVKPPGDDVTV
jgi:hypothetical protein